jgi:antitoxin component of MazEF toxin-antitoxin module
MTVPLPVLKTLNWKEGDTVEVGLSNNSMVVKKGRGLDVSLSHNSLALK